MREASGRKIKVEVIQLVAAFEDKASNLNKILELLDEGAKKEPDLIILPELCTTPYWCLRKDYRYFDWAETIPGPTLEAIGRKAKKHSCSIVVPIFEKGRVEGEYYNSAAVVGPSGELIAGALSNGSDVKCYRKVHLPTIERPPVHNDEKFYFRPGLGFPVFVTPKAVIGILICWDRCFPEGWRVLALQGAEVIIMTSAIPSVSLTERVSREEQFLSEMCIRAFENQTFVVGCNRGGTESFTGTEIRFFGRSCVIDPFGSVLSQAPPAEPAQLCETLDLDRIKEARFTFPLYHDRRPDLYSIISEPR
jgi:N-carbamoylputrescine amidase